MVFIVWVKTTKTPFLFFFFFIAMPLTDSESFSYADAQTVCTISPTRLIVKQEKKYSVILVSKTMKIRKNLNKY